MEKSKLIYSHYDATPQRGMLVEELKAIVLDWRLSDFDGYSQFWLAVRFGMKCLGERIAVRLYQNCVCWWFVGYLSVINKPNHCRLVPRILFLPSSLHPCQNQTEGGTPWRYPMPPRSGWIITVPFKKPYDHMSRWYGLTICAGMPPPLLSLRRSHRIVSKVILRHSNFRPPTLSWKITDTEAMKWIETCTVKIKRGDPDSGSPQSPVFDAFYDFKLK